MSTSVDRVGQLLDELGIKPFRSGRGRFNIPDDEDETTVNTLLPKIVRDGVAKGEVLDRLEEMVAVRNALPPGRVEERARITKRIATACEEAIDAFLAPSDQLERDLALHYGNVTVQWSDRPDLRGRYVARYIYPDGYVETFYGTKEEVERLREEYQAKEAERKAEEAATMGDRALFVNRRIKTPEEFAAGLEEAAVNRNEKDTHVLLTRRGE